MEEVAAAWQMTLDMKLGLFQHCDLDLHPLAVSDSQPAKANLPYVLPHNIWTKVRYSA